MVRHWKSSLGETAAKKAVTAGVILRRWTKGAFQGSRLTSADSAMNALGYRSKISWGRLAAVAKALADAKVNIEAILAVTAGQSMFSVFISKAHH